MFKEELIISFEEWVIKTTGFEVAELTSSEYESLSDNYDYYCYELSIEE